MNTWAIILAGGQGTRLGAGTKKQFISWRNRPLFWHSILTFSRVPKVSGLVFVLPQEDLSIWQDKIAELRQTDRLGIEYQMVAGGRTRQESAWHGLQALPAECCLVLIHDAARPFVQAKTIQDIITRLELGAPAVIPGIPVKDTIKQIKNNSLQTLPRDFLHAVQTPQGFQKKVIFQAYLEAQQQGITGTDDASLVERVGLPVELCPGDENNIKITTPADLDTLRTMDRPNKYPIVQQCVGLGYDVHRFGSGRPLKLGGVPITNGPEVKAHSDGDVLLHAVIDAILGCLGLGDIGDLFPDTDPSLENISSGILLAEVVALAQEKNFEINHLDLTIVTQIPKISPWKSQIKKNIQQLLNLKPDQINLKATTEEGLGFTGEKKGIKALALIMGQRRLPVSL